MAPVLNHLKKPDFANLPSLLVNLLRIFNTEYLITVN